MTTAQDWGTLAVAIASLLTALAAHIRQSNTARQVAKHSIKLSAVEQVRTSRRQVPPSQ